MPSRRRSESDQDSHRRRRSLEGDRGSKSEREREERGRRRGEERKENGRKDSRCVAVGPDENRRPLGFVDTSAGNRCRFLS